jgi:hypothetical protein
VKTLSDNNDAEVSIVHATRKDASADRRKAPEEAAVLGEKKKNKSMYGGDMEVVTTGRLGEKGRGLNFDQDTTGRSESRSGSQKERNMKQQNEMRVLGFMATTRQDNEEVQKGVISDADYVESQQSCCGGGKSKPKGRRNGAKKPQVRKMFRSWANFSLLSLYSHRNAWANLHILGQPNTFLALTELHGVRKPSRQSRGFGGTAEGNAEKEGYT